MPPPKSGRAGGGLKSSSMTQFNKPAPPNKRKAGNKNGHTGPSLLNYFKRLKPGESTSITSTGIANHFGGGLFLAGEDDDEDDVYASNVTERRVDVIEVKSDGPVEGASMPVHNERDSRSSAVPFVLEDEDGEDIGEDNGGDSTRSTALYSSSPFEIVHDDAGTTSHDPCETITTITTEQSLEETASVASRETVTCPVCAMQLVDQMENWKRTLNSHQATLTMWTTVAIIRTTIMIKSTISVTTTATLILTRTVTRRTSRQIVLATSKSSKNHHPQKHPPRTHLKPNRQPLKMRARCEMQSRNYS
ncbi:hypothetical protein V1527DRAFT_290908 [Lipomyces starkeyi]